MACVLGGLPILQALSRRAPPKLDRIRTWVVGKIRATGGAQEPSNDVAALQKFANWSLSILVSPLVYYLLFSRLAQVSASPTFGVSEPVYLSLPLGAKESSGIVGIATSIASLAKHLPRLQANSHEYSYFGEDISVRLYRINCVILLDPTLSHRYDGRRLRHISGDLDTLKSKTSRCFDNNPFFLLTLNPLAKRIVVCGRGPQVFSSFFAAPLNPKPDVVGQSREPLALWPFSPGPVDLGEGSYYLDAPLLSGPGIVVITTLSHHDAISTTLIDPPEWNGEPGDLARHVADQVARKQGNPVPFVVLQLFDPSLSSRFPVTRGRSHGRQQASPPPPPPPPQMEREHRAAPERAQLATKRENLLADQAFFQTAINHLVRDPIENTWYTRFSADARGIFEFDLTDTCQISQAQVFGIGRVRGGGSNARLIYRIERRRILLASPCESRGRAQAWPDAASSPPAAPSRSVEITIEGADTLLVKSSSQAPHAVVACCATARICSVISTSDGSGKRMRAGEDWDGEVVLVLLPKKRLLALLDEMRAGLEYPDAEMDDLYYFGKRVYEMIRRLDGPLMTSILIAARIVAA